jgi:O-antigen ligase/tetratricopeptide (TPR) repeat protein
LAKANKNQRAARRQAARKQAARGPAGKQPPADKAAGTPAPQPAAPSLAPDEARADALSGGRRISWWALLAMVFLVPVAFSNLTFLGFRAPFTYDAFDIIKMSLERVLGLVALGAWSWDMLRRGGRLRRTPLDWLILAFLAWVALTTVTSIHWPTALFGKPRRYEGLLSFVNYAVIYFLVLQLADSASRVRRLAQSLFAGSLLVAGYGLLQFAGLEFVKWNALPFETNRAFSTYGNPDLLGGFLIFSVTVALGLALMEQKLAWRLVYWVGFGVNGLALIVAFTRGAWIGGAVSLMILGVIAWRQRATMRRIDWAPAGVSVAVGLAVIWRSLSNPDEVMNFGKRLASIFQFSGGSGQTRTEIWQAAIAAIKERPVLGWGADTFRLVFPKFKPIEYVRDGGGASVADNAHDYPLQLASGIGIPGMLMFYGIFVWAGVRSFATVFRRSGDPSRLILGAFWAAAAGYLVQLFFGISVTGTTFLLWIALALVLVPTARLVDVRTFKWGTAAAVVVLALVAAGVGYQGVVLLADNAYVKAQTAPSYEERTAEALRAVKLNRFNQTYRGAVGLAYLAEARGYLDAGVQAQKNGEDTTPYADAFKQRFASAEAALKDAIAFVPDEYDNYVSLADLYNLGGEALTKDLYNNAIDAARQGLEIEPFGTAIRVQLARSLLATGKTAAAVKILEYCVRIDPMGSEAALTLASVYRHQGKIEEALAVLQALEAVAPGQPNVAEAIQQLEASSTPAP